MLKEVFGLINVQIVNLLEICINYVFMILQIHFLQFMLPQIL